jgi:hypothetical protein
MRWREAALRKRRPYGFTPHLCISVPSVAQLPGSGSEREHAPCLLYSLTASSRNQGAQAEALRYVFAASPSNCRREVFCDVGEDLLPAVGGVAFKEEIDLLGDFDFLVALGDVVFRITFVIGGDHPFGILVEKVGHAPGQRIEHEHGVLHPAGFHKLDEKGIVLVLEPVLEVGEPFIGHALAAVEEEHVGKMRTGFEPRQERRGLLRELAVDHEQHPGEFAAGGFEPSLERLDLVHGIGAAVGHNKHMRRLAQRGRHHESFDQAPTLVIRQTDIHLHGGLRCREQHEWQISGVQATRNEINQYLAATRPGGAKHEIDERFLDRH